MQKRKSLFPSIFTVFLFSYDRITKDIPLSLIGYYLAEERRIAMKWKYLAVL